MNYVLFMLVSTSLIAAAISGFIIQMAARIMRISGRGYWRYFIVSLLAIMLDYLIVISGMATRGPYDWRTGFIVSTLVSLVIVILFLKPGLIRALILCVLIKILSLSIGYFLLWICINMKALPPM